MKNDIERISNEMIRFIIFLAKYGMAFYNFDKHYFLIDNMQFYFNEDFDDILVCVRNHYKTSKNIYKVTFLEDYVGCIAVGYQNAKKLAEEIKNVEFSREEYAKQQLILDLFNAQETLGVMKWASSSISTIREQEELVEHLEEELKNFDKNLERILKEHTKIEKLIK